VGEYCKQKMMLALSKQNTMSMHAMMSLQRKRENINMTLNGKRTAAARSADVIITSQTLMNDAACGII
jgi:hypothetical protein